MTRLSPLFYCNFQSHDVFIRDFHFEEICLKFGNPNLDSTCFVGALSIVNQRRSKEGVRGVLTLLRVDLSKNLSFVLSCQ